MIGYISNGIVIKKDDVNRQNRISLSLYVKNSKTKTTENTKQISISFNSYPDIFLYINQLFIIFNNGGTNMLHTENLLQRTDRGALHKNNLKFNVNDILSKKDDNPYYLGNSNKLSLTTKIHGYSVNDVNMEVGYNFSFMIMLAYDSIEITNQILMLLNEVLFTVKNHIDKKILKNRGN